MTQRESYGIVVDDSRDELLTEQSKVLLSRFYLKEDESIQDGLARPAVAFCGGDMKLAQRIYDYVSKMWFMYASPVLSNAPKPGTTTKALPISCFLTYVDDTLESLIDHTSELRWLSVAGGGVGGHWSTVRSVSNVAPGPIPFIHTIDADMQAYKQGTTRKGAYAAYMDVSHPDIEEFIHMRVPSGGGDLNRKAFNIHNAVNITDDFMEAVIADADWNLVDPHTGEVRETLKARKLWTKILTIRGRTGEPYLFFIDTANRDLPQSLKNAGLKINGSNLCSEVTLPTSTERTAVCCLSSINIAMMPYWDDTTIVEDMVTFLDNVLTSFLENADVDRGMARSIASAESERSIGLGAFGYHSFLQSQSIPFESSEARMFNDIIFKMIHSRAVAQSEKLAEERGAYPLFDPTTGETPRRNSHLIAIAPNANSSSIAGTSPSIELLRSNAYVHDTRAGSHLIKNTNLEMALENLGMNTDEVWNQIIEDRGSVQNLNIPDDVKLVYKTASEVDQREVIKQAADRQKHVCQAQSVNLYFKPTDDKLYVRDVHERAWRDGLKSLYYLRTDSSGRVENATQKVERDALVDFVDTSAAEECTNCHG